MAKLLLVEDSEDIQKIVKRALNEHVVTICTSVDEATTVLRSQHADLILLDINLPLKNGYSLLQEVAANHDFRDIPVICLTGRTDLTDKITAFSMGAEDYVVKPFDPIELQARINAKLKRRASAKANILNVGGIEVDVSSHRVKVIEGNQSREVSLTQTEFKLLYTMARSVDRVFSRDQLLVSAWGEDARVNDRVVDVHLCSLRKKLGKTATSIQAVPGVGYRLSRSSEAKKAG
jgi:two-component system phosphate regulon response regulator PhoB